MSRAFFFRIAETADAEHVAQLVNFVYRGESGQRSWTGEAHLLAGQRTDSHLVSEMILDKDARIILAGFSADFREPIGCVYIRSEKMGCYLGMLASHVEFQ